jgi:hypothetical protein
VWFGLVWFGGVGCVFDLVWFDCFEIWFGGVGCVFDLFV